MKEIIKATQELENLYDIEDYMTLLIRDK